MNPVHERVEEVCVGMLTAIPIGEGRTFSVGSQEVAVFRGRDGSLFAVESRCPHRGAPLADGLLGGGSLICPYHSYRFDLKSGACLNDASCSLRTYPVREHDGRLLVRIG